MKSDKQNIVFHPVDTQTILNLPYASAGIKAGFPSPAQDYMDISIVLSPVRREAKDLGIPMGEPVYKIKDKIKSGQVSIFSSNYSLYGVWALPQQKTLAKLAGHFAKKYPGYEHVCLIDTIGNWQHSKPIMTLTTIPG